MNRRSALKLLVWVPFIGPGVIAALAKSEAKVETAKAFVVQDFDVTEWTWVPESPITCINNRVMVKYMATWRIPPTMIKEQSSWSKC